MAEPPPPPPPPFSIDLAAISLSTRIPDFWLDQPRLWFIQVEAMLEQQKASDKAKYNVVVAKLGKEAIQQVADILYKPPDIGRYETLKTRLLTVYEESETRKLQKLITEMDLGDQQPSQLLRRMRDLARDKVDDNTLNILWQGHLPPPVRAVLAATSCEDLEKLAAVADKVMETFRPAHIAEIANNNIPQNSTAVLMAEIAKINVKLMELDTNMRRSRSTSRGPQVRSPSRSRSRARRTPESPDWLCYYHYKFNSRAQKCVEPCSWKKPPPEN